MNDTLFKWDDSFLIGIEELDHAHKVLIDDINRQREELERLCRYVTRPAVSEKRLSLTNQGKVRHET